MILVVEDECLINMMAQEELDRAGFSVLTAFNADDAVGILESRSDIDVVFTDINMPGRFDGLKLAAVVRDRWPPVHLIITSGKESPDELPERAVFVPKPYRTETIVELICSFH